MGTLVTIKLEDIDRYPFTMVMDLINLHAEDCKYCGEHYDEWDDTAIHMVDVHNWDTDYARLWLRDRVEEKYFNDRP